MPIITPSNIWYPDDKAPVAPLENLFIQMGQSVNIAIDEIRRGGVPRVANVGARDDLYQQANTAPRQGDRIYNVERDRVETYFAPYSAQNPNGSLLPGWYGTGGLMPEAYLRIVGGEDLPPNVGVGLTGSVYPPEFFHGGQDFFDVNGNKEIKAKIGGFFDIEFRLSASGPSTDAGSVKAFVLRNNRQWNSSPTPETVMIEDEKPSRTSRQWLSGHAPRVFMNPGDWVQLGVRTVNTSSPIRFGNQIDGNSPGMYMRVRYVTPRRAS